MLRFSLPGSKWDNPSVVVKMQYYTEVEEFAELYGFKFTEAARKAIEDYKEALIKVEIVKPAEVEEEPLKDGLADILNSGSDIIDDLKD